tara:strand:+ start:317 stop:802 length:486 start_codon:yes stop_codon:yes gene_type:complete
MKKKIIYILPILLSIFLIGCSGYEPIFGSKNINFKISDYSISGDTLLGKKIYSKFNNLSKSNKDQKNARSVSILINISKNKESTAKDSAGKILEYKISLENKIKIYDYLTDKLLINENKIYSQSFSVQDQISETIKIENKTIEDLLNKIYQDLIIKLSQTF